MSDKKIDIFHDILTFLDVPVVFTWKQTMLAVKHQATQDNRSAKQQWWTVFRSMHANFMPKLQALPTHTQYHNKTAPKHCPIVWPLLLNSGNKIKTIYSFCHGLIEPCLATLDTIICLIRISSQSFKRASVCLGSSNDFFTKSMPNESYFHVHDTNAC